MEHYCFCIFTWNRDEDPQTCWSFKKWSDLKCVWIIWNIFNLSDGKCELNPLTSSKIRRRNRQTWASVESGSFLRILDRQKSSLGVFCGIFVGFFIWLDFYLEERHFLFLFMVKCLASACSEQIHAIGDKQYCIQGPVPIETSWMVLFPSFTFPLLTDSFEGVSGFLQPLFSGS